MGRPILNLANPAVRSELEDLFDYWLSKGVDGFSLRGHQNLILFENAAATASLSAPSASRSASYASGVIFSPDQLNPVEGGVAQIIAGWRRIFESHRERTHRARLLMLDATEIGRASCRERV